jgi:hypothetical protein
MGKKGIKFVNENVNVLYVLLVYVLFALAFMMIISLFSGNPDYRVSDLFDSNANTISDELATIINKQNAASNKINKAINNKYYTIDDPYVLINPYKLNPLSAIIVFTTDSKTTVTVTINGDLAGITESDTKHVIPVYGLFSMVNNTVELTLEDGTHKVVRIETKEYDSSREDIAIEGRDTTRKLFTYYRSGDITNVKAFSNYDNLVFYLSGLNYIRSYSIDGDKLKVLYDNSFDTNGILLTMDYFGHIESISSNLEGYSPSNYSQEVFYPNGISNYKVSSYNNKEKYSKYAELDITEISDSLAHAKLYDGKFSITYNDEYLSLSLDTNGYLILVRNDGKILSYSTEASIIRISNNYDYSLFLNSNDTYYNLYTTIKNS